VALAFMTLVFLFAIALIVLFVFPPASLASFIGGGRDKNDKKK
jgi:hypothetical protein